MSFFAPHIVQVSIVMKLKCLEFLWVHQILQFLIVFLGNNSIDLSFEYVSIKFQIFQMLEHIFRRCLCSVNSQIFLFSMVKSFYFPCTIELDPLQNVWNRSSSWFMWNYYSKSISINFIFLWFTTENIYNSIEYFEVKLSVVY